MSDIPLKDQLHGFIDDLERSLRFRLDSTIDCDNIILCGVGGSAVSGDFAADCCYSESTKPIILVKYPDLPEWVGSRTLAVISSYSGNTAETLHMHDQAKARGCTIVNESNLNSARRRMPGEDPGGQAHGPRSRRMFGCMHAFGGIQVEDAVQ